MSGPLGRVAVAVLLIGAGLLPLPLDSAVGADAIQATIDYTVTPMAYDNAVRVADPYTMDYPRIVVDTHPGSPHLGTVYVVATKRFNMSTWCIQLVTSRSADGGATFSVPEPAAYCLGSEDGIRDAAVSWDGDLLVLASGGIMRSVDQGSSWFPMAPWRPGIGVLGISVNPEDGVLFAVGAPPALVNQTATLQVSWTADEGSTWSAPVILPVSSLYFEDASIAAESSTVAVATLVRGNASGRNSISIVALASQDGGSTWPAPTVLAPSEDYPLTPQIRASPQGVIGVSWENVTFVPVGNDMYVRTAGIAVSRSFDRGRTFSAPERISDNSSSLYGPHGVPIAFDNASRMYVTWESTVLQGSSSQSYLYTAISAPGLEGGPFAVGLQWFGVNGTEMEDLAVGLNDTAYLSWYAFNLDANFTVVNATSGVYVRTVTGLGLGNVSDPSRLLSGTPALEFRASDGRLVARAPWTGSSLVLPGLVPDTYRVTVASPEGSLSAGTLPVRIWGETRFTVSVTSGSGLPANLPPGEGGTGVPWPLIGAAGAGVGILAAALSALHFTRLKREDVFQRKVRLLLFEYIRAYTGATLAQVRSTFGLHNGVTAYHLGVLEAQGFLHSEARRGHRWYFPNGDVSLWKELPLSPLQSAILRSVEERPGIGVRELSRALDRHVSSVADNVKALEREGVLRTQRAGRRLLCFPAEAGRAA